MQRKNSGFTLLELSMVVVVIGLIIGGIVIARGMIRNAELQTVASDFESFKRAALLFKDKYKSLPGDMPNATDIWGTHAGGCSDTLASDTVAPATCNGNGNGMIGGALSSPYSSPYVISTPKRETLLAWQHMSNAGFIKGAYSGTGSNTGVTWYKPGLNIPPSKLGDSYGYTMAYALRGTGAAAEVYYANYQNIIVFGSTTSVTNANSAYKAALTGADAKSVDLKIDDGKPGTGIIRTFTLGSAATPNCTNSATAESAIYDVTTSPTSATCSLIYITGF